MDSDLIQNQRNTLTEIQRQAKQEGCFQYEGSPSADKHLTELNLTRDQIQDCEFTDERIMVITESEARGYKMLDFANKGNFHLLIPELRAHLHAAGASKEEFDKVVEFEKIANPTSEDSKQAAWILAQNAYRIKKEVDAKFNSLPAGQLDYSKVRSGLNLQTDLKPTFGSNGSNKPGQLAY